MKALGYIMFFGGLAYFAAQLVVAGAQIALWQAKKHGCGDWDKSGKWQWRSR